MQRTLEHIFLRESGEGISYKPVNGGSSTINYPVRDSRKVHGNNILRQFERAWKEGKIRSRESIVASVSNHQGIYLQIKGKQGFDLITRSLESIPSGIRLVNVKRDESSVICATLFIPYGKQELFIKKIKKYRDDSRGTDVIGTIESIQLAMLDAFWMGKKAQIPAAEKVWCEVWIRYNQKDGEDEPFQEITNVCEALKIKVSKQKIIFPERIVLAIQANAKQLIDLLGNCGYIAEFRRVVAPTSFFTGLPDTEQREWIRELEERIEIKNDSETYVCLLDTGVNNTHPLIAPVLTDKDCQAVNSSLGTDDRDGHGTRMAGLATYFSIKEKLEAREDIELRHSLESVKILNKPDDNDESLYGAITAQAISLAETENPNGKRAVCMAITAESNAIQNDGRPSSWSGAVDSIVAGVGEKDARRLMLISAGNTTIEEIRDSGSYKTAIENHSVEDPGQAWNALTVGAFTDLTQIYDPVFKKNGFSSLAEEGDISPFSSTSLMWDHSKWPIKPEIMFEGGNLAYSPDADDYSEADDLSLLTTNYKYLIGHPFTTISMTSAATAQASWMAAQIWARYPDLWPETVRALMVHSASWTQAMKNNYLDGNKISKKNVRLLLRTCGYGVPSIERATWSAENAVNMIIQDELQPCKKKKDGSITSNEMHIHQLPWPGSILESYGDTPVEMRVTLSYYIEPGPGEIGWRDKYRYPSCRLRFDVNNPTESRDMFLKRISAAILEESEDKALVKNDSDRWTIGVQNRNVGSIHSDIWRGNAGQLAACNMVIVYPVKGWWASRGYLKRYNSKVRYSLIVSIEMPKVEVDLYSAIKTEIKNRTAIKTEITAL